MWNSSKTLNDKDVLELYNKGDIDNLIIRSVPIVWAVMRRLKITYHQPELLSAGTEALVKATQSWSPKTKVRYINWCWFKILDAILAELVYVSGVVSYGHVKNSESAKRLKNNPIKVGMLHENIEDKRDDFLTMCKHEDLKVMRNMLEQAYPPNILRGIYLLFTNGCKPYTQKELNILKATHKHFINVNKKLWRQHNNKDRWKYKKQMVGVRKVTVNKATENMLLRLRNAVRKDLQQKLKEFK